MAAKDGDVVWFFEQVSLTLANVEGYQPLKGTVQRTVKLAGSGLTTVDVLVKDPTTPASRNSRVVHNVAYIPANAATPLTGYYAVADKGDGTGPATTTIENPPTRIAPPIPNPIRPQDGPFADNLGELAPGDEEDSDVLKPSQEAAANELISNQGTAAAGSITVTALPIANDTLTVNGTVFTFKASPAAPTDLSIAGSVNAQATAIAAALNGSADANVSKASYAANAAVVAVAFKTVGTVGNAFTLAKTSAGLTVSGATLTGGVNAA